MPPAIIAAALFNRTAFINCSGDSVVHGLKPSMKDRFAHACDARELVDTHGLGDVLV